MPTYGVTPTGFNKKTFDVCFSEREAAFKEAFGAETDTSPNSPDGLLIAIEAEREADLWDYMEDLYNSQYPDTASGVSLRNVGAITGTTELEATPSTVTGTATGTSAALLNTGRIIQVQNDGARFVTTAAATLAALTPWAITTGYVVGDRRSNGGNSYICITAGTSAGSGGPTTESDDITDGTVHWMFLGNGTYAVDVECESEDTGPNVANAGTLNDIVTAVAGWSSFTNLLDADLGRSLETDPEFRVRREEELRIAGNSALEAIRQDLLALDGVDAAIVLENDTDEEDGDGRPPHSFECVVLGDVDEDVIAQAIWDGKPAGIQTFGAETGTATDSQGATHDVDFAFADEELAWITFEVTKKTTATMDDTEIEEAVQAAFVAWAEEAGRYTMGTGLVTSKLDAPIWLDETLEAQIEDVTEVTTVLKDTTPTGGEYDATNKTVTTRQIVRFDTSRVIVNVT